MNCSYFWPAETPSQLCWQGAETLKSKKKTQRLPSTNWMWSTSPTTELNTLCIRIEWATAQSTEKYNSNKRQINGQDNHSPENCLCLCLYFLTQQYLPRKQLFSEWHTWLWAAAGPPYSYGSCVKAAFLKVWNFIQK